MKTLRRKLVIITGCSLLTAVTALANWQYCNSIPGSGTVACNTTTSSSYTGQKCADSHTCAYTTTTLECDYLGMGCASTCHGVTVTPTAHCTTQVGLSVDWECDCK